MQGAFVVAEAVVRKPKRLGQHPALAVVLAEERLDAGVAVAAALADLLLEVAEGDQREHRMAQFGVLILVHAPEALRV